MGQKEGDFDALLVREEEKWKNNKLCYILF